MFFYFLQNSLLVIPILLSQSPGVFFQFMINIGQVPFNFSLAEIILLAVLCP
ncbi:MAG: hypothetical protein NT175_06505 [Bacteroidetes bacterium]|nr:hypothetical protein [Bacteroidota bacterium]